MTKSLILTSIQFYLAICVMSNSTEIDSNIEELCSESYFDRLITRRTKSFDVKQQVFELYRSVPSIKGVHHYWNVTVERNPINNSVTPVSISYRKSLGELPEFNLTVSFDMGMLNQSNVQRDHTPSHIQSDIGLMIVAFGFNLLDKYYYALEENISKYSDHYPNRRQYVRRIDLIYNPRNDTIRSLPNEQFGKIPVLQFLGIDCPEEEDESFPSDEAMIYICGVLLFFALVLPIVDLWLIEERNRITKEIYDDSRLGSLSMGPPSATHSSEDADVIFPAQRRNSHHSKK